jgi:hypothetical protein
MLLTQSLTRRGLIAGLEPIGGSRHTASTQVGPQLKPLSALCLALSTMLSVALPSAGAFAQAEATATAHSGIAWQLTAVGAETYRDTSLRTPINKRACEADAQLHIALSNIPVGYKYLEVWTGQDCQNGDRALRVAAPDCQYVGVKEQEPTTTVDTDFTIHVKPMCDLGDGAQTLYVLPVNTQRGIDNVLTYAKVTLLIDQTPPDAPTDVTTDAAKADLAVSWTEPSDGYYCWIVVDSTASATGANDDAGLASGACTSQLLQADGDFNPTSFLPDGITVRLINERASRIVLTRDDLGSSATRAAIAVIAEDIAHNRSPLSNLACGQVGSSVATPAAGTPQRGGGCTVLDLGQPNDPRAWPLLAMFGLLGWRQRHSRQRG